MSRPLVVVVTGSECTGKTSLAARLAAGFDAPVSGEYARRYVDEQQRVLTADDVEPIARGQIAGEDAATRAAARLVIKDTDLVSTAVYARHYYGACPPWVEQEIQIRLGDLYLLLHPDVPWVADGLQRDRPAARHDIHQSFVRTLADLGARVVDIRGGWETRDSLARGAVRALLAETPRRRPDRRPDACLPVDTP